MRGQPLEVGAGAGAVARGDAELGDEAAKIGLACPGVGEGDRGDPFGRGTVVVEEEADLRDLLGADDCVRDVAATAQDLWAVSADGVLVRLAPDLSRQIGRAHV